MAERVLNQDSADLDDALVVADRNDVVRRGRGERVLLRLRDRPKLLADGLRRRADVDLTALDSQLAGIEP